MSWDVYIVRTKVNSEEYAQIEDSACIPITKDEFINVWEDIAKKLNLSVMDTESKFPHLRGDGWSMEACFYDDPKPECYLELQIRGTKCPDEVFRLMKQKLNARIFDSASGKFIEDTGEKSFNAWKELVETIIHDKF